MTSEPGALTVSIMVKMECDREEHWFIEVSATLRQVEPWKRRLWATSSVAARWVERFRTTTSPLAPSAICTWEDERECV